MLFVFLAMVLGMQLAGLLGVMGGVMMVPMRHLGMMGGHHMIFLVVKLGSFAMMFGSLGVMVRGLAVMFGDLGLGHGGILHGVGARPCPEHTDGR